MYLVFTCIQIQHSTFNRNMFKYTRTVGCRVEVEDKQYRYKEDSGQRGESKMICTHPIYYLHYLPAQ